MPTKTIEQLTHLAREASVRAYAPYSHFRVGAALAAQSGAMFSGCNVENAAYGLTNCAERTAIFSMVAAGETSFEAIVVYTPTEKPIAPCGACRQVLFEFNPDAEMISVCDGTEIFRTSVRDLLPEAFGPKSLT
ncbi:MAG: cytidine deaminase [Gemmataceae bacterium]|nr:cytidine deaminase [Gemmataceae bacterium]